MYYFYKLILTFLYTYELINLSTISVSVSVHDVYISLLTYALTKCTKCETNLAQMGKRSKEKEEIAQAQANI